MIYRQLSLASILKVKWHWEACGSFKSWLLAIPIGVEAAEVSGICSLSLSLSLSLSILTLRVCLINQNLDIGSLVYYRKVRKIIAVGMGYRLTLLLNRGIFFFLVNLFAKPKQESSIASWVPICFDITYVTHKISSACVIFDWWTNSRYYWRFCNLVSILMELASWHPSHLILCVLTLIVIMLYINKCLKDK